MHGNKRFYHHNATVTFHVVSYKISQGMEHSRYGHYNVTTFPVVSYMLNQGRENLRYYHHNVTVTFPVRSYMLITLCVIIVNTGFGKF